MTAPPLSPITSQIRRWLAEAQGAGTIPRQQTACRHGIDYRVMTSRDLATGQITVRIEISGFAWITPEPHADRDITAWMLGPGRELVAAVDRITARDSWDPPLAGRTELIAEYSDQPQEDV